MCHLRDTGFQLNNKGQKEQEEQRADFVWICMIEYNKWFNIQQRYIPVQTVSFKWLLGEKSFLT